MFSRRCCLTSVVTDKQARIVPHPSLPSSSRVSRLSEMSEHNTTQRWSPGLAVLIQQQRLSQQSMRLICFHPAAVTAANGGLSYPKSTVAPTALLGVFCSHPITQSAGPSRSNYPSLVNQTEINSVVIIGPVRLPALRSWREPLRTVTPNLATVKTGGQNIVCRSDV